LLEKEHGFRSSVSAGEDVCARVECARKFTEELRMKQDTDLEKKGAQEWGPGKEEGNEHLREKQFLGGRCTRCGIRSDGVRRGGAGKGVGVSL